MATISFTMDIIIARLHAGKPWGGSTGVWGFPEDLGGDLSGGASPLPTPLLQPTCGCTERSETSGCSSTSRGPCTPWHWLPSPPASPRASPRTPQVSQLHPDLPGSLKCPLGNGEPLKFGFWLPPPPGSRLRHRGAEDHPDGRGAGGLPGHQELRSQGGGTDLHPDMRQHTFPWESGERSPSEPQNPRRFSWYEVGGMLSTVSHPPRVPMSTSLPLPQRIWGR